jgi:polar amino acid transport system substrate-binding protein
MKNRRMRMLTTGAAIALGLSLTACGGGSGGSSGSGSSLQLISDGQLKVCSDAPYLPFDQIDGTKFTGFDGDLITKMTDGLNLDLVPQDSSFDALKSGLALNSNQCDVVASAMTITPERQAKLDFTDGYYDSEQSLLVAADSSIATIDDLAGKKVGVQTGTTGETYAKDHVPSDTEVVSFPDDSTMFNAIKGGSVDALLQDLPVNLEHTKDGSYTIVEKYDTGEQYGFAVKKGNSSLLDALNQQLQDLRDSGEYKKIYDQYFATK